MRKIVYRLTVYATMPLADDAEASTARSEAAHRHSARTLAGSCVIDDPDLHTLESATSAAQKRAVERHIFNFLKRSDYDCDAELMDFTVEEE